MRSCGWFGMLAFGLVWGGCTVQGSSGDDDASDGDDTGDPLPGDDDETPEPVTGCDEANCIYGEEVEEQFGAVKTSVFATVEDGQGSARLYLMLSDYAWTCSDLTGAPPVGETVPPISGSSRAGMLQIYLGRYEHPEGTIIGSTAAGLYYLLPPETDMTQFGGDTLIGEAAIVFTTGGDAPEIEPSIGGYLELETSTANELIGAFRVGLESGGYYEGFFQSTLCDFTVE